MQDLLEQIGYSFKKEEILVEALTHSSYGNENHCPHNERMEFLGDSVLGFVMAEALFTRYPEAPEGDLSKQKSVLVSTPSLAKKAKSLNLGSRLRMGEGEKRSGGHKKHSILADAMESVIAAIFLDGGIEASKSFILNLFEEELSEPNLDLKDYEDFKTQLQEKVQGLGLNLPQYHLVEERGPSHDREFQYKVVIEEHIGGIGHGTSKKSAQQEAARITLHDNRFWQQLKP